MRPLDKLIIDRICSMYRQNYKIETISKETGISINSIRSLIKSKGLLRPEKITIPEKPSKYDYLINEPRAQGKMYEDYFKKNK